MREVSQINYQLAQRDFHRARKQAVMRQTLSRFRNEAAGLLCFDDVRQQLRDTGETIKHGLQEIPLNKIVGSVSRYSDFTRDFLPKKESDEERWAGVKAAVDDMVGIAPIDVYQLGDAYFIQDGNHRVSVARRMGSETISAYVTEIKTRVPLTANDDPNEIICKSYYADFLEKTNLDKVRPDVDMLMTFCKHYKMLQDQIQIERQLLEKSIVDTGHEPPDEKNLWEKAVTHWYDLVYLPVVHIVRELGVLHRFPERTEADMYVLLSERQIELEEDLGWHVEMEASVSDLVATKRPPSSLFSRLLRKLLPSLDSGPIDGVWRRQQLARKRYHHLFEHILVPLDGTEEDWEIFDYTLDVAVFDHDHILGLHVVPRDSDLNSDHVRQMRARFEAGCQKAGLKGELAIEVGSEPAKVIIERAAWADVVMVSSRRPPEDRPLTRLSPGLKMLAQHCPRPLLVRPRGTRSTGDRALLAYGGSPKADEALFVATYLTARRSMALTVLTVETAMTSATMSDRAQRYLTDHGITDAEYIIRQGHVPEVILETADASQSNVLFLGGFSFRSVKHMMLGSTVERILRVYRHPMWICR